MHRCARTCCRPLQACCFAVERTASSAASSGIAESSLRTPPWRPQTGLLSRMQECAPVLVNEERQVCVWHAHEVL